MPFAMISTLSSEYSYSSESSFVEGSVVIFRVLMDCPLLMTLEDVFRGPEPLIF